MGTRPRLGEGSRDAHREQGDGDSADKKSHPGRGISNQAANAMIPEERTMPFQRFRLMRTLWVSVLTHCPKAAQSARQATTIKTL